MVAQQSTKATDKQQHHAAVSGDGLTPLIERVKTWHKKRRNSRRATALLLDELLVAIVSEKKKPGPEFNKCPDHPLGDHEFVCLACANEQPINDSEDTDRQAAVDGAYQQGMEDGYKRGRREEGPRE